MNIMVRNKKIIFAKYKVTATRTVRDKTITRGHVAYDEKQRDEVVAQYLDPWNVEVTELQFDDEIIAKAERLKGKVMTKSEAIKKLQEVDKDEIIQQMALAIATLDAELQMLKGGI